MATQLEAAEKIWPTWTLGDRLRKARRVADVTQEEIAEVLGVPRKRYEAWERGASAPRGDELVRVATEISQATRVPVEWLLGLPGRLEISSLLETSRSLFCDQAA